MKEGLIFSTVGAMTTEEYNSQKKAEEDFIRENNGTVTEEQVSESVYDSVYSWWCDEYSNLFKTLDGKVVAIADIGTWHGRFTGYKILRNNLNEILKSFNCDDYRVTYDRYTVRFTGYHHDGTNYVEFRELREDRNYANFLEKLYNQEPVSRQEIRYYTKSLRPYIKEIYGN